MTRAGEGDELVSVQVDQDVCIAAGQCESLEASTFLVDDDEAVASVIGEGLLPRGRAELVIARCPSAAISIVADS